MGRTTKGSAVTRPRRRRWIVFAILGLVLGGLVVLFLAKIYNPFGSTLSDPLVLAPDDADFAINITEFPDFLRHLRERPVARAMAEHPGFQRFLETESVREKGFVQALRKSFQALDSIQAQVPLGLDLLGDVSGDQVAVAGYVPRSDEEEWRFMLVFQPGSWKTLAGANVFLDETLFGWFVEDALGDEVGVTHYRDMVRIEPRDGRPLYMTRLADAVVVSTEERQLGRIITAVLTKGLPTRVAARFLPFTGVSDREPGIDLVTRRDAADRALKLQEQLDGIWGPEDMDLVLSVLPRLADEDVFAHVDIGQGIGLTIAGPEGDNPPQSLATLMRSFDREELLASAQEILGMMPRDAFGFVYLQAEPGDVFRNFYERPALFSDKERELFDEELARMPAFGSRAGFFAAINELGGDEMAVVFFRQPRDPLIDRAQVGYALVIPVLDGQRAIDLLRQIEQQVVASRGEGPLKELVPLERDGHRFWRVTIGPGVVDDDRITVPGIALVRKHLILTNYEPFLRRIGPVLAGKEPALWDHPEIQDTLPYLPRRLRLSALLSYDRMLPWLKQSIDGWATSQSEPDAKLLVRWAGEARREVELRGIDPDLPQGQIAIDRSVEHKKRAWMRIERERAERSIRTHIDSLTGLLGGLGLHIAETDQGVGLVLRVDLSNPGGR